ncbi:MAG: hypothetical protein ACT4QC_14265 [Planctomycetaceae bacterium]
MEPSQELVDEIYRERVLRARAAKPEEKLLAGARIFERVCRVMADGIRSERPEASAEQVRELLKGRLEIARRLERTS